MKIQFFHKNLYILNVLFRLEILRIGAIETVIVIMHISTVLFMFILYNIFISNLTFYQCSKDGQNIIGVKMQNVNKLSVLQMWIKSFKCEYCDLILEDSPIWIHLSKFSNTINNSIYFERINLEHIFFHLNDLNIYLKYLYTSMFSD